MTNIFIGGAWPYANGSLHLGGLQASCPATYWHVISARKAIKSCTYPVAIVMERLWRFKPFRRA